MRMLRISIVFCALVTLAVSASADHKLVREPQPGDPMPVYIYQLDNGLTVNVTENHEQPRFYSEIAVRAGSKDDPPETTGLAHYFEHIMFKGSERLGTLDYAAEKVHLDRIADLYEQRFHETDETKRADLYKQIDTEAQAAAAYAVPNELDRVYNAMGATDLNAHTSVEETVYQVDLPKNRLRQWAAIESDRFEHPVFRLFPTELETVYEEKNRSMDNKQRLIYEEVGKLLFKKHPYGQETVLGRPEHLKNPSINNITRFFHEWYVPNDMAISISGDVNHDEVISVVEEYFGGMADVTPPQQKQWAEEPLNGREHVEVNYEAEPFVLLAFRTAPNLDEDAEALKLMDMILDNASAGLINLNLNQAQLVRNAGAHPIVMNDYGAECLYGVPKDGQTLDEVEKLLLDQIEIVKRGEFEDWILPAIVNDFKKNEKAGLESNQARAGWLSGAFIAGESWDRASTLIERISKVTKDDIVRVANKYFSGGYVSGWRLDAKQDIPKVEKPLITKVDIDPTRESEFSKRVLAMPCDPIEPVFLEPAKDYTVERGQEGRTLYYVANPINDLFSLTISMDVGTQEDNTINIAAQLLDKSGTERLSPEDLQKEWYKLGATFGIGAGDNETSITITGLDENFDASLGLLMEVLTKPTSDAATLEELKKIILVQRADAKKQAESISSALIQYHRYGDESSYLRMVPKDALLQLSAQQLYDTLRNLLTYKHTIAYTGSIPLEKVRAALDAHFPVAQSLQDPPPYKYLRARRPDANEIYFFDKEAAQASIRIEFGEPEYDAQREAAIQLFNEYFGGGMASIVFQELREARGLAYSAGARYVSGARVKDEDLMLGVIQTQPDKAAGATAAFLDLMDKMPVSEDRFQLAREAILNLYRTGKLGFREIIGVVRTWERKGLASDPRKERYQILENATMDTVLNFQKELVGGKPKLISIVGDKNRINMQELSTLGKIQDVPLTSIFID